MKNNAINKDPKTTIEKKDSIENIKCQKGYKVLDMETLIKKYDTPLKQIVEHIVVEKGATIIAGTDGVGKTWFSLQMAFCIATGKDFIGFKTIKRPVLVIQFELSPEQLADRLKSFQESIGTINQKYLDFAVLENDLIFSNAWEKVKTTVLEKGINNGVIIIDNIYGWK